MPFHPTTPLSFMMMPGVTIGRVTRPLLLLLMILPLIATRLNGQQSSSFSASQCKQLYDERRYVEARDCFSQLLTRDPKDLEAQTYYRLSNLGALGISSSVDSSHTPGTPEVQVLRSLIQEALKNDPEVHRIQLEIEGLQSGVKDEPSNDLEFIRIGALSFYPCRCNPSSTRDAADDAERQKPLSFPSLHWWQSLLQSRENELVAQVKKSYFRLLSVRQELLIHDEHRRYLTDNKRITLARYRQNQVSQGFLLEVQQEETQSIEDLIQLERREALARASLNSCLNRDPALLIQLPEAVEIPQFLWDLRQLENLASVNRPERRAAIACLEQVSLQLKTTGSEDKTRRSITIEEQGIQAVEAVIKREVHEAFINADNSYRLLKFCETTLIPQLETAFLSAQASYRSAEGDYDRLIQSQRQLTAGKVRRVTTQSEYLTDLAELERAVGVPLEKPDAGPGKNPSPSD